jgi:hypothetical protein
MPSHYDIDRQQKLLAMYRSLLTEYLRQTEMWDRTETPAFLRTGVSNIRGYIRDSKGTLRGWKVFVADAPIDEGPDNDIAEEVATQRGLLKIHRTNLSIYLKQQSEYVEGQVPPVIIHSLNLNRNAIQRIKAILRGFGVEVDDLPEEAVE